MKRLDRIVDILETAVNREVIGAHRNFWRGKTRDQFIALKVFGKDLLVPGKSADSNLIKALRGIAPFGADVDPPQPGAIFERMPAGRPAVPDLSIAFIEKWIDDGCPDDDVDEPVVAAMRRSGVAAASAPAGPDVYVQFFRELDQFFNFAASDQTEQDIGSFFNVAQTWPGFNATTDLPAWNSAIADATVKDALKELSDNQLRLIAKFFGDPADRNSLNDALWQFGMGTLPADDQRPRDRFHRMNGATMWLMWLAFADASVRLSMNAPQWAVNIKSICLGLVGDALFRTDRPAPQRLKITRYNAQDPNLEARVVGDFAALADDALLNAAIGLGREALFGAPVA